MTEIGVYGTEYLSRARERTVIVTWPGYSRSVLGGTIVLAI